MDKNTERENFEVWALTDDGNCNHQDLRKNRDGEYINQLVERDFLAWQAGRASLVSPAAELSDAIERANARLIAHPEPVAELTDEFKATAADPSALLSDLRADGKYYAANFISALLARSPAQPQHENFDAWQANPYTKVLQQSIKEDYVPRCDTPAAPEQKAAQPAAMSDAEINDITMNRIGKWPSFEAQSWACKVVHVVIAALPPVQPESKDAEDPFVEYFKASESFQATLGHPDATAEDERRAEARFEAARAAMQAGKDGK